MRRFFRIVDSYDRFVKISGSKTRPREIVWYRLHLSCGHKKDRLKKGRAVPRAAKCDQCEVDSADDSHKNGSS